jgi:signal transduction histidine kinase
MRSPDGERRARIRATHRVVFLGHFVIYASTIMLIAVIFLPAAIIVALAWGIGLAAHGFFGVAAPILRDQWIEAEVARVVPEVKRASENKHAKDVEKLAASLAHEIRNPIAAAKSLVRQIGDDPSAPEAKEYARVAEAELDRVETSIAHLLRFAREEPMRTTSIGLRRVVETALEGVRERTNGVRVETAVADVALEGDEDKLRRAVVNLVTNAADAVRAMPEPRRAVAVEGGASFDGQTVWVRVRDEGPGIDPSVADRVFDPWVTGKDAGTGLGLPIARKLCEAHGGSLEIERTGDDGTSMLVTLPRGGRAT